MSTWFSNVTVPSELHSQIGREQTLVTYGYLVRVPGTYSLQDRAMATKQERISPWLRQNEFTNTCITRPQRTAFRREIWLAHYGLRNPWRLALDRAATGDMYIGDVGQSRIE